MKKSVMCAAISGAMILAGCGSKQDANEKNFSAAISQYLDARGELCLRLNNWPVDVTEMELRYKKTMPAGTAGQMEALEAVGLVSGVEAEVDQLSLLYNKPTGKKFKVKRYDMTDAGKKFYREKLVNQISIHGEKKIMQGDLCYGKMSLDKIIKWEGPMKFGDYQQATVRYRYKIDDLADWTKKPEFQVAFPRVAKITDETGRQEQMGVKLTNLGWEPILFD